MKRFLLYTFFILAAGTIQAQNGYRLEALKIAYVTKKMDLNPDEAQRFWPLYNQYTAELRQARQYAQRSNQNEIDLDEALLNIRKKYNSLFMRVLPAEKVNIFFRSEKEFGAFVQKEMERRDIRTQRRNDNKQ
jgi:hypothetical protein